MNDRFLLCISFGYRGGSCIVGAVCSGVELLYVVD